MKNQFTFQVESLLYGIENPKGAIEHVLFAKRMAEYLGIDSFNRIARVSFGDNGINKEVAGAVPLEETLLLGQEGWNDTVLHLCIRSRRSACKIATVHFPNREVTIDGQYRQTLIMRKLTGSEIQQIFNYVWDNLELIQPMDKYLKD